MYTDTTARESAIRQLGTIHGARGMDTPAMIRENLNAHDYAIYLQAKTTAETLSADTIVDLEREVIYS